MSRKKQTMMQEYFTRQKEHTEQYGSKAVVLYQCGGFYEIYEEKMCTCDNPSRSPKKPRLCANCDMIASGQTPLGKVTEIENIWNVHKPSKTRWWMIGFPTDNPAAFMRHISILVDAGWTVAVYKQKNGDSVGRLSTSQEKVRTLDKIYSKGTFHRKQLVIDDRNVDSNEKTMCIYVRRSEDLFTDEHKYLFEIGVATYSLDTQAIACGEVYTTEEDRMLPFARLRSLLCEITPTEYLLVCDGIDVSDSLDLLIRCGIRLHSNGVARGRDKRLQRAKVRESVFTKMFRCGKSSGVPVAQRIGVARYEITALALAEMVTFLEHHDRSLVHNLPIPTRLLDTNHLILHTTALRQLDVIVNTSLSHNNGQVRSLMDVVNTCITASGRELLRRRICRPATEGSVINQRHSLVTAFLNSGSANRNKVANYLRQIKGLARVNAALRSHKITYKQVVDLVRFVECTKSQFQEEDSGIKVVCKQSPLFQSYLNNRFSPKDLEQLALLPDFVRGIIDVSRALNVSTSYIEGVSCFQTGYDLTIDHTLRKAKDIMEYLRSIAASLRAVLPANNGTRLKTTDLILNTNAKSDKRRYLFELSNTAIKSQKRAIRGSTAIAAFVSAPIVVQQAFAAEGMTAYPTDTSAPTWEEEPASSHTYKNKRYILFRWQDILSRELHILHEKLIELVQERFEQIKLQLCDRFYDILDRLSRIVSEIDVAVASASTAFTYSYTCPEISEDIDESSSLDIVGLRHPIVERLDGTTAYVGNDVVFDTKRQGYLVHGVNAAGKSVLMKSVGLAVIMAQAGLYVAASSMKIRPYKHLFTRITKGDDLFNNLSSFQVEMLELGAILRRCTNNSLVIGDEICSGTETVSAVGIVGASVIELLNIGAHFMFATHLHELRRIRDIHSDSRIRSVHMLVHVDAEGVMTYMRKLADGPGPTAYGIEACTGIITLPVRFLRNAQRFRYAMIHTESDDASSIVCSKYNHAVLCAKGNQCTYPGCNKPSVDVHHITHQSSANEAGFIADGRHKNARSNLMLLCKEHHKLVHAKNSPPVVAEWVSTNKGAKLVYDDATAAPQAMSPPRPLMMGSTK